MSPKDWIEVAGGILALPGAVFACRAIIRKELREHSEQRAQDEFERDSIRQVLMGRDAIPYNSITGQEAQPAIPSIGEQVKDLSKTTADLSVSTEAIAASLTTVTQATSVLMEKIEGIEYQLNNNGGGSFRDKVEARFAALEEAAAAAAVAASAVLAEAPKSSS